MGNLSNRAIHEVFGCPTEATTTVIDFSDTPAIVELDTNSLYRFAATEDCLIDLDNDGSGTPVTEDGVLIFAGVPEVFSTTGKNHYLAVIRKTTDGELYVTKMLNRGN